MNYRIRYILYEFGTYHKMLSNYTVKRFIQIQSRFSSLDSLSLLYHMEYRSVQACIWSYSIALIQQFLAIILFFSDAVVAI